MLDEVRQSVGYGRQNGLWGWGARERAWEPAVREFLETESELLDEGRFLDWYALFAQDGWYWVTADRTHNSPYDGPSHAFEKGPLIRQRCLRLQEERVLPLSPPPETARFLGNVRAYRSPKEGVGMLVKASFLLTEARTVLESKAASEKRVFSGVARYALQPAGTEDFRISWKRVDLIDEAAGHYGLSVPV